MLIHSVTEEHGSYDRLFIKANSIAMLIEYMTNHKIVYDECKKKALPPRIGSVSCFYSDLCFLRDSVTILDMGVDFSI